MSNKDFMAIAEKCLDYCLGEQSEVVIIEQKSNLTRFANSSIHQNVAETNINLAVRVIDGQKSGYASTNILTDEELKKVTDFAFQSTKFLPADPDFKTLPGPKQTRENNQYSMDTARVSPRERAKVAGRLIDRIGDSGWQAHGTVSNSEVSLVVVNSLGVKEKVGATRCGLTLVVRNDDASGYSEQSGVDWQQLNPEKQAMVALTKAKNSKDTRKIEPGKYVVILEPLAVADMVATLAFCGFGALSLQEGRSFLTGKLGQKLVDEKINLQDDAFNKSTIGFPFDFEGQPKEKIKLIEKGLCQAVVYDSYTAGKDNTKTTGHALPAPNQYGPMPTNLIMSPGDRTVEEIISETEKAILVTRFHYTNVEDPLKTVFTGMTRDGTYLVEDGKIKHALKNLRFTQSILDSFSQVHAVSQDLQLCHSMLGYTLVPSLKLNSFNFTGVTEE